MHYHAHIYFEPYQLVQATQLHKELSHLPVQLGRIHQRAIGPHPLPMFQVLFSARDYKHIRSWLENHRGDLDVLLHRETGDTLQDHTRNVEWLGDSHALKLDVFRKQSNTEKVEKESA